MPTSTPPAPSPPQSWSGIWLAVSSLLVFGLWALLPLSYYRMVAWPWILLWQGGALSLLAWNLWRLRQWSQPFRPLGHGLDGVLLGLGITLGWAGWLSDFHGVALWNISLAVTWGLGLYALRNGVGWGWLTLQRLWAALVAVATGSAVISLGLWQPAAAMWQTQDGMLALRNPQPLGHHNFVGGYLVLVLPLAVAAGFATKGWWRILVGVSVGLLVAALYVSGSRGSALGFLGWLVVSWLLRLRSGSVAQRWRLGLGGLLAWAIVLAGLMTNPRIRQWLSALVQPGGLSISDGPTLDRWFMLRLGGNILGHRPWFGVGPGAMGRVSNLYRPIETGAGLDHIQQLHNTPLQLAGELGLVGLALVICGLILTGRLWWRLWRQPLTSSERALLGGIGGSGLAYGITSLSDYQLENLPIVGTLLGLLVLLLALGDRYGAPSPGVASRWRRLASLAVWGWMALAVYIWLPLSLTIGFDQAAADAFQAQKFILANNHWQRAQQLSPWDPTAGAVASETLYDLLAQMGPSMAQDQVRSLMLDYAQSAQAAAPYDIWFNQNLAVMEASTRPDRALPLAERAVQLLPRHLNYGYWLLGQLYLAQQRSPQAIAAFSLEALVRPETLTFPHWQAEPLQSIYPAVVQTTLEAYDRLLAGLTPADLGFRPLYETRILLAWWTGRPLGAVNPAYLRPSTQALLLAEADPGAALQQVENAVLASGPPTPELRLLAAWLDPDGPWLQGHDQAWPQLGADALQLRASLEIRSLRPWLRSRISSPPLSSRVALALSYRNYQARNISLMLPPPDLQRYTLIDVLGLFPPWPREFPPLDYALERLKTEALQLPHPTSTGFRLIAPHSP